jgi:hypothetical protein
MAKPILACWPRTIYDLAIDCLDPTPHREDLRARVKMTDIRCRDPCHVGWEVGCLRDRRDGEQKHEEGAREDAPLSDKAMHGFDHGVAGGVAGAGLSED